MIGVLSLQGAINEHQKVLDNLGVDNRAVLEPTDLEA